MKVLGLMMFLLASSLQAQSAEVDCSRGDLSNIELKYCASLEYKAADAELNRVYRKLVKVVKDYDAKTDTSLPTKPEAYRKLVDAQKAWIQLRDRDCDLESVTWLGGTGYGLVLTTCLTEHTRSRTEYLKKLLTSFEL